MSATFLLAALIMVGSPLLLRAWYGAQWMIRPFSIFALMAIFYHLVTEVVIRITGATDTSSGRPSVEWVDQGMLIAATTLAAMTLGYMVLGPRRHYPSHVDTGGLGRILDWRITGALTLPLLVATVQGQGYSTGMPLEGEGIGITGLAMQFFVPLVVLTSFGYLLRHPTRWLPTVAVQSTVLVLAGQRLEVFIGAAMLTALGARVGITPKARHVLAILVLAGFLALGVTSVRASQGRETFYSNSGVGARVTAIAQGAANPLESISASGNLLGDAAIRLNSNAWTGGIARAFHDGASTLGYRPFVSAFLSMIPSALYPDKLTALSDQERSIPLWTLSDLGMPAINYLPGHLTYFLGAVGWVGNLILMAVVGAFMGAFESRVLRSNGYLAVIAYALLVQSALFFEQGLTFYLVGARSFVVLAPLFWVWLKVLGVFGGTRGKGCKSGSSGRSMLRTGGGSGPADTSTPSRTRSSRVHQAVGELSYWRRPRCGVAENDGSHSDTREFLP